MSTSFELNSIDRFHAVAVGRPGQRAFYLVVAAGDAVFSLKCEKQHVAVLAQHLERLLTDLPPVEQPLGAPPAVDDEPRPLWRVGSMGLGYDASNDRIVVMLHEFVPDAESETDPELSPDDDEGGARARLSLTRPQAAAFARHGAALVASGRPPCALCGTPINPDGFNCGCFN